MLTSGYHQDLGPIRRDPVDTSVLAWLGQLPFIGAIGIGDVVRMVIIAGGPEEDDGALASLVRPPVTSTTTVMDCPPPTVVCCSGLRYSPAPPARRCRPPAPGQVGRRGLGARSSSRGIQKAKDGAGRPRGASFPGTGTRHTRGRSTPPHSTLSTRRRVAPVGVHDPELEGVFIRARYTAERDAPVTGPGWELRAEITDLPAAWADAALVVSRCSPVPSGRTTWMSMRRWELRSGGFVGESGAVGGRERDEGAVLRPLRKRNTRIELS